MLKTDIVQRIFYVDKDNNFCYQKDICPTHNYNPASHYPRKMLKGRVIETYATCFKWWQYTTKFFLMRTYQVDNLHQSQKLWAHRPSRTQQNIQWSFYDDVLRGSCRTPLSTSSNITWCFLFLGGQGGS